MAEALDQMEVPSQCSGVELAVCADWVGDAISYYMEWFISISCLFMQ